MKFAAGFIAGMATTILLIIGIVSAEIEQAPNTTANNIRGA